MPLPKLKKLIVHDSTGTDVLRTLECPNLDELSFAGASQAAFPQLLDFITSAHVNLLVLDFDIWHNFEPREEDIELLRRVLDTQTRLKKLSIGGAKAMDGAFLDDFALLKSNGEFPCCPLLTELYLSGTLSRQQSYTDFVNKRCRPQDGSIFKMTFHNCKIVNEQGPPHHKMHIIEGVERSKMDGLELIVSNDDCS